MLALALAALVAPISHGTITVNRGIAGARLGMSRAQVVSHLGRPLSENANGVMSYEPDSTDEGIFDVYRNGSAGRVRLFILAGMHGGAWKLGDGNAIFAKGGIDRLYAHFGTRVHRLDDKGDGSLYYYVNGRFEGRKVRTSFQVDRFSRARARVLDVYVTFMS
jgi:hypothetical protein